MDNRDKPNRGMMEAETPSDADSHSLEVRARSGGLLGASSWDVGLSLQGLARDAVRTRRMVASGMVMEDHIWPDVSQSTAGAWLEPRWLLSRNVELVTGARVDVVRSDAKAIDDMALGAAITDQYVRFNGPDADDVTADEVVPTLRALLRWSPHTTTSLHTALGLASRPAGMTERYYAFAPAPGGYQVGNPTLAPERRLAVEVGVGVDRERSTATLTAFGYRVDDYILAHQVARQDVNGDGAADRIIGFDNVDASFTGAELAVTWSPHARVEIPMDLSFVRARNTTDDHDLPETPPLQGSLAVRANGDVGRPLVAEIGVRFAAEQDRVFDGFPEDATSAFAVWHVRAEAVVVDGVRLSAAVENLFDTLYHDHLTREAILPVGDLAKGDEVPEPGRQVLLSLRTTF